ncbi:DUF6090 family protein [Muriicola sp. Z0-33]|uniref:DUF6090 family protein n=1 Tax=Muriicola sp. Z0-33 TaxID=2816957 RepID=UPI00223790FD|nr:DUF6090 family protein [Muriicola sp. Z0-33]MCW5515468.1 hypothetical protein [Muriicola sp. Z0-33]
MLKFFRHIRQNLLTENKFSKYLLYAFGEIALVVIGILIALSINNWNESRQKKEVLNNIYGIVAEDIKKDASEVAMVLNFMKERKKLFEKILNDSLQLKDIEENEFVFSILTDVRVLSIEKRGYNLLRNFENNAESKNDSLAFKIINFYASSIFFAEKVETIIIDDLIKTNDLWKSNDWYSNIMQNKRDEQFINYMLTSKEFKNLCAFRYSIFYENYMLTIEQYRDRSQRILEDIKAYLDNNS